MKRLILFNLLLGMVVLCSTSVEAQTQDQNRKISRKEQREIAQQQANQQFEIARQALQDSMFVIEVDRIIGQLGRTVYVSANENFVLMNRDYASVQLAVLSAHEGMNGVGGIHWQVMYLMSKNELINMEILPTNFEYRGIQSLQP